MAGKFFYLYLVGGTVALALLIYSIIIAYPAINASGALFYVIPTLALYYMAYKVRREKEDKDMM